MFRVRGFCACVEVTHMDSEWRGAKTWAQSSPGENWNSAQAHSEANVRGHERRCGVRFRKGQKHGKPACQKVSQAW